MSQYDYLTTENTRLGMTVASLSMTIASLTKELSQVKADAEHAQKSFNVVNDHFKQQIFELNAEIVREQEESEKLRYRINNAELELYQWKIDYMELELEAKARAADESWHDRYFYNGREK